MGTPRGFLKKLKSIPTLSFGKGLVFHLGPSGKNLECQKLSDPSLSNPVSDLINEQPEDRLDINEKHMRTCSIASDESITSMSSFQTFSESMDKPTASPGENKIEEKDYSTTLFKSVCPPGGENSVIFYTTSLTGIRKTFNNCTAIRFLLQSFKIKFYERDVSMDLELRNELWKVMGEKVIPPRLFIKGQYIGGADEVVGLHEQGKLHKLLHGITHIDRELDQPCQNCFNIGFVLCSVCNGSCKLPIHDESQEPQLTRCSHCNENGLIRCVTCST